MGGGASKIENPVKYELPDKEFFAEYKEQQYYVTNPWDEKPIIYSKKGPASREAVTLFHCLDKVCSTNPDFNLFAKEYPNAEGKLEWKFLTRKQFYDDVIKVAKAFIKLGLKEWEAVCILGFNSFEWHTSFYAAMYAGGVACGLYTTNNAGQCEYIVNHSKCRIAIVENKKQLDKFLEMRDKCTNLTHIVVYNDKVPNGCNKEGSAKVISWSDLCKEGEEEKSDEEIKNRVSKIKPGQCCSLIYTSGTTGKPKGVMISHDNLTYLSLALYDTCKGINWKTEHRVISYLPLSHIAAQFVDIISPIMISYGQEGNCDGKATCYFGRADALKGSLKDTLKYVKPTIHMGVPRVWEKMEEGMKRIGKQSGGLKKSIGSWAKGIGSEKIKNKKLDGKQLMPPRYSMANKMVFSKIREQLGLTSTYLCVSAAAPIKKSTLEYFGSLDIEITQAYGASESTGVHTVGLPYHDIFLSVGVPVYGGEVKIDHNPKRDKKDEGEILLRGRNVMMGYIYDAEKSKATIDDLGYYHSGDVGKVDKNNLLFITGRIKELIITAGGENVAPVPIEDYIKTELEAISNCVLIGDERKYLTVLLTLKCFEDKETMKFSNELVGTAKEVDASCKTTEDARKSAKWDTYITNAIKKYNNDANACASNAQKIQYYTILDGDFSVPGGELTGTMKLKRAVITTKYAQQIEDLYDSKKLKEREAARKKSQEKKQDDEKKEEPQTDEKKEEKPKEDEKDKVEDKPNEEDKEKEEPKVEQPKDEDQVKDEEPKVEQPKDEPKPEEPEADKNENAD